MLPQLAPRSNLASQRVALRVAHLQNPLVLIRDMHPVNLSLHRSALRDGLQERSQLSGGDPGESQRVPREGIHTALVQDERFAKVPSRVSVAEPASTPMYQRPAAFDVVETHGRLEQVHGGRFAGDRLVPDLQPDDRERSVAFVLLQHPDDAVQPEADRAGSGHADRLAVYEVEHRRYDRSRFDTAVRQAQLVVGFVADSEHCVEDRTGTDQRASPGVRSLRSPGGAQVYFLYLEAKTIARDQREVGVWGLVSPIEAIDDIGLDEVADLLVSAFAFGRHDANHVRERARPNGVDQ